MKTLQQLFNEVPEWLHDFAEPVECWAVIPRGLKRQAMLCLLTSISLASDEPHANLNVVRTQVWPDGLIQHHRHALPPSHVFHADEEGRIAAEAKAEILNRKDHQ